MRQGFDIEADVAIALVTPGLQGHNEHDDENRKPKNAGGNAERGGSESRSCLSSSDEDADEDRAFEQSYKRTWWKKDRRGVGTAGGGAADGKIGTSESKQNPVISHSSAALNKSKIKRLPLSNSGWAEDDENNTEGSDDGDPHYYNLGVFGERPTIYNNDDSNNDERS